MLQQETQESILNLNTTFRDVMARMAYAFEAKSSDFEKGLKSELRDGIMNELTDLNMESVVRNLAIDTVIVGNKLEKVANESRLPLKSDARLSLEDKEMLVRIIDNIDRLEISIAHNPGNGGTAIVGKNKDLDFTIRAEHLIDDLYEAVIQAASKGAFTEQGQSKGRAI